MGGGKGCWPSLQPLFNHGPDDDEGGLVGTGPRPPFAGPTFSPSFNWAHPIDFEGGWSGRRIRIFWPFHKSHKKVALQVGKGVGRRTTLGQSAIFWPVNTVGKGKQKGNHKMDMKWKWGKIRRKLTLTFGLNKEMLFP